MAVESDPAGARTDGAGADEAPVTAVESIAADATGTRAATRRTGTKAGTTGRRAKARKAKPKGRAVKATKARTGPSMAVRRACFLEVLRRTGNVSGAAREAGMATSTLYTQRARTAAFARDWDGAIAEAMDELEGDLLRRARQGTERPVFFRGAQIGSVRTYSDNLAMFLLRARRPEVYDRLRGAADPAAGDEMTEAEAGREVMRRMTLLAAAAAEEDAQARADAEADADPDGGAA